MLMKILIVAATSFEIEPLLNAQTLPYPIDTLITGVGMTQTAYTLGKHLALNSYDLIINLGIAGSFDRNLKIGEVVEVTEDRFAELGAEDGESFLSIEDLGFGVSVFRPIPFDNPPFYPPLLKKVNAITVNQINIPMLIWNQWKVQQYSSLPMGNRFLVYRFALYPIMLNSAIAKAGTSR